MMETACVALLPVGLKRMVELGVSRGFENFDREATRRLPPVGILPTCPERTGEEIQ